MISISVAPATRAMGRAYYDLEGSLALMHWLWQRSAVDGFEFQILAEWDAHHPPRDDAESRFAAWSESARYTVEELSGHLREAGLPVLSVHAERDVGICLCSGDRQEVERDRLLIHQALSLAEGVGAGACVFHLWDTWKVDFDVAILARILQEIAAGYPRVKAAVENVPTHLAGHTPFDLAQRFEWITLDLRWAAMYDELGRFEAVKERLVNVHLRGRLAGERWALDDAPFGFYEALGLIRHGWGYSGLLTMEPTRLTAADREGLVVAMASLRPPASGLSGQGRGQGTAL